MAKDNRAFIRRKLVSFLNTCDAESGECIGKLVDITPEGFMLVGTITLPIGAICHLSIELPGSAGTRQKLFVDAQVVWTGNDANPRYVDTGFTILDTAGRDVDTIVRLIAEYSSPE